MKRSPCIKRQGKPTESFARRGLKMNAAEADPSNVPAPCPVQGFSIMDPTPSRRIHPFTVYQMSPSHTIRKVLPSLLCMRELQPFITRGPRFAPANLPTGRGASSVVTDRQAGWDVSDDGWPCQRHASAPVGAPVSTISHCLVSLPLDHTQNDHRYSCARSSRRLCADI